jgi:hypothetical protein
MPSASSSFAHPDAMKLAIMQPYLFPYLGYFQLIHAVDKFVFYDDVSWIKGGWINRNRYLHAGEARFFTVRTEGASSFVPINAVGIDSRNPAWRKKLTETLRIAYKTAPFVEDGMRLFREVIEAPVRGVGEMARLSVRRTLDYLGVSRELVDSSAVYGNAQLRGAQRVVDICRRERADTYVNAPGGRDLYRSEDFAEHGCRLMFLAPHLPEYDQGGVAFVPGLSILDLVMRCPPERAADMLGLHRLEPGGPRVAQARQGAA